MTDLWIARFEERRQERIEGERTFELLGEKWRVRPHVAPETALRYYDLQRRMSAYVTAVQEAEAKGQPAPAEAGIDDEEMLQISEATIRACLDPASLPTWERARDPQAEDPLDLWDIYGIASYMLARASGLPTAAPTGSSNGRATTSSSSKAASSSRAKARKG